MIRTEEICGFKFEWGEYLYLYQQEAKFSEMFIEMDEYPDLNKKIEFIVINLN